MRELSSRNRFHRARLLSLLVVAGLVFVALPVFCSSTLPEAKQLVALGERNLAGGSPALALNQPIGTTQDRFGKIYVADTGNNRVVKIDLAGRLLMVIGTAGPSKARLYLPSDVTVDAQGFIYVADTMNHRVVKFDSRGRFRAAWGGLHGPSSLTLGPDGFLYVADTLAHRIVKLSRNGVLVETWGHEGSGPGELRFPRDVAVRASGVYVTDFLNHRVVKFSHQGQFLRAWGSHGSEPGQFNHPWGITVDPSDNIWVMDLSNNRIQRISQVHSEVAVLRLAGGLEKWYGESGKDIQTLSTTTEPTSVDGKGTSALQLVVSRSGSNRIEVLEIDPSTTMAYEPTAAVLTPTEVLPLRVSRRLTEVAGDEKLAAGSLQYPIAARLGVDGLTYIADTGNSRIVVLDGKGRLVRTWGSFGSAPGQLNLPADLVQDAGGDVYVADTMNNRIQKFSPQGELLAVWGSVKEIRAPHGIAIAGDGSIFVADTLGHRIVRYTPGGKIMATWGGQGSKFGALSFPHGLAVDGGFLYVADFLNHRIAKFTLEGAPVETWGRFGEGPAEFRHPWGVAIGPDHSIWVSDMTNSRIQRFTDYGTLLGVYGSYGADPGQFDHPKGIDINAAGEVAVGVAGLHAVDLLTGAADR